MKTYKQKAIETAEFIKARIKDRPEVAFLTGTGLGDCVKSMDVLVSLDYKDIPHFPMSTVISHFGNLLFGVLADKKGIVFQGRFHLYEGYSPLEVTFPVRIMQELGIRYLILSNAAGGLDPGFNAGDIMVITDHLNLTGSNPLTGPNEERWGARFPDMVGAYDDRLGEIAEQCGSAAGVTMQKGIYAGLAGPSLETPAEVRFLRQIGASAVGFSTVQEVIAAVHAKIKVLGLSIITNVHNPDQPVPANVEEILSIAESTVPKLETILQYVVKQI